jgi:hypothetical protein
MTSPRRDVALKPDDASGAAVCRCDSGSAATSGTSLRRPCRSAGKTPLPAGLQTIARSRGRADVGGTVLGVFHGSRGPR